MQKKYWNNRNILISGATGFIGSNLARRLQSLNANVYVIIRPHSSTWRLDDILPKIHVIKGDLCHYPDVENAFSQTRPDVFFHLATARGTSILNRTRYVETSILGISHLIDCLCDFPDTRLVTAGSSMEYAAANGPIPETYPLAPNTVHGAVKVAAGVLLQQAAQFERLAISQLRIFHVYGPWESSHRFLPQAILRACSGQSVPLSDTVSRRDWVHVDDVVTALLTAALPEKPTGIFNIGSGVEYTNDEILNTLENILNQSISRQEGIFPKRPSDSEHRYANIEHARIQLGWTPQIQLQEGIQNTLEWISKFPNAWQKEGSNMPTVY